MSSFASFLASKRLSRRVTATHLAESAGVTSGAISRLESGDLQPSRDIAQRLATALGESQAEWLLAAGYVPDELRAAASADPGTVLEKIREACPEPVEILGALRARLEVIVSELCAALSTDRDRGAFGKELEAWGHQCRQQPGVRTAAVDSVLLELAAGMVPADIASAWSQWLPSLRGRARAGLGAMENELARRLSAAGTSMLGPLFEALAPRQDRYTMGQFFTPAPVARFMADIIAGEKAQSVLDPAVGAGVLLAACPGAQRLLGVDVSPVCAALATAGLVSRGVASLSVSVGDFLFEGDLFASRVKQADRELHDVDAVICNPPYVRHHLLEPDEKRRLADRYARLYQTPVSALSTTYVYFLLEALRRLKPAGILVFITPADYLDVKYGAAVREVFRRQATVEDIFLFDRMDTAFEGVLTTSAVTVVRRKRPLAGHKARFSEARLVDGAVHVGVKTNEIELARVGEDIGWSNHFGERKANLALLAKGRPKKLSDYIRIRRGIATGGNGFFLLGKEGVQRWGIDDSYLLPVVASARDLPDGALTENDWLRLRDSGRPCWIFNCTRSVDQLRGTRVLEYVRHGEESGVHQRFNCRTRNPWYRIESVPAPDIIITYMNRGRTRFVENRTDCRVMSVFLNGFLLPDAPDVGELLDVLNSEETAALIKQLGRTYGGGLGKIEPGELANIPMPIMKPSHRRRSDVEQQ